METERREASLRPLADLTASNLDSMEVKQQPFVHENDGLEDKTVNYTAIKESDEKIGQNSAEAPLALVDTPELSGPVSPKQTVRERAPGLIASLLSLVPPLFFVGVIISAARLQSQSPSPSGERIRQICLVGPTIFPIVFSAIVGWCLKTYGRYKSERGVKLGYLERVIGSQTLFSSVKLTFQLKEYDALSLVLVVLWCLSPLGGQSILRMLTETQQGYTHPEALGYFDLYSDSYFSGISGLASTLSATNGLYLSCLYAPLTVKESPTDLWGSIKIPFVDSLDTGTSTTDWVVVDQEHQLNYTSLLGIPVNSTFSLASSSVFTFNTTNFMVQCNEPYQTNLSTVQNVTAAGTSTFFMQSQYSLEHGDQRNISLITFPSDDYPNAQIHNCTITANFLLAEVGCHFGNCTVNRMKRIPDPSGQTSLSLLVSQTTWGNIISELPSSTGLQHASFSSQTERYLWDPTINQGDSNLELPDLSLIPIAEFSKRFTTVINTYYQATLDPAFRLGSLVSTDLGDPLRTTAADVTTLSEIYVVHWEWIVCGLVASIAMLSASIVGIMLQDRVIGPDIFGYVSSLTRDNPHIPFPRNGCMLDGTQRTVLLKNMEVRLEDVAPDEKIGHIAFAMANHHGLKDESDGGRLRRDKQYSGL